MTTCIVGGGIIGLAVARTLLVDRPDHEVVVLDKEPGIAQHQTSHNSGVVHAGIYYRPGSANAELCRRGVGLLRDYCSERSLPYDACGKLVVARDSGEAEALDEMIERATRVGVPGLELLGPDGIREREPHVVGRAALWSPTTAIVDFAAVAHALASDVAERGGAVRLSAPVIDLREGASGVTVEWPEGSLVAEQVVVCAGLHTDRVARMTGGAADPAIVPFRGEYLRLRPERAHLVRGLVYPVPDPRYPFLGVHLTKRVDGTVDIGPNAVLALSREGYRWRDVSARDLAGVLGWPGTRHLARNHWRTGVSEVRGSLSRRAFVARARGYLPVLSVRDVVRGPSGVRAQALDRSGRLVDDFVVERHGRVLAVRNAPSPAATSSLAIAERVVQDLCT